MDFQSFSRFIKKIIKKQKASISTIPQEEYLIYQQIKKELQDQESRYQILTYPNYYRLPFSL